MPQIVVEWVTTVTRPVTPQGRRIWEERHIRDFFPESDGFTVEIAHFTFFVLPDERPIQPNGTAGPSIGNQPPNDNPAPSDENPEPPSGISDRPDGTAGLYNGNTEPSNDNPQHPNAPVPTEYGFFAVDVINVTRNHSLAHFVLVAGDFHAHGTAENRILASWDRRAGQVVSYWGASVTTDTILFWSRWGAEGTRRRDAYDYMQNDDLLNTQFADIRRDFGLDTVARDIPRVEGNNTENERMQGHDRGGANGVHVQRRENRSIALGSADRPETADNGAGNIPLLLVIDPAETGDRLDRATGNGMGNGAVNAGDSATAPDTVLAESLAEALVETPAEEPAEALAETLATSLAIDNGTDPDTMDGTGNSTSNDTINGG
ncbi:hypothetical protein ASPCADRAFT_403275 [Aspergillus carbonarius ITEM 5010]|uniref:Uncharacterized protein n=1 Tax=Aspergillus carbonarius (strain ITEM 5010) TaxID=602072 RepID=A0A1R3RWY7_ASPC5|nr:hypothetical protein ASPCADRAFT_403275 [Aspergillus carbonarius ITEM 5010]